MPYEVLANTYYQQLSDSSGFVELIGTPQVVGSFTVSMPIVLTPSGVRGLVVYNANGAAAVDLRFEISSTTSFSSLFRYSTATIASSSSDVFYDLVGTQSGSNRTLVPGHIYYVFGSLAGGPGVQDDNQLRMNLSNDFFYGYLTDSSGESLPISPGIPGFTDYGIATSSQQVYCYGNFASTTGLLDSVAQSISIGICNVGVFLFVPSNEAISNFQALASTSQSKIPFSYVYGLGSIYSSLTASTSVNLPTYTLDLPALGTTTPLGNILPDSVTFLSTTTIDTYYPTATRETFLFLGSSAIWLGLAFILYRRVVPHHTIENKT